MEKELKKAFNKARYEEEQGLVLTIWNDITIRNKRMMHFKLWAFSSISLASLIGLIPILRSLSSDLTQSGIYDYLSLLFSNNGSISFYWRELALSIAESLPTMGIILSLSLILILFLSLKFTAKQIIKSTYFDSRHSGGQLSFS